MVFTIKYGGFRSKFFPLNQSELKTATEVVNTYDLGKCSGPYKCVLAPNSLERWWQSGGEVGKNLQPILG